MFDFRVTFDKTESFTASVASKFQICEMGMLIKRKVTTDFITLITFSTAFTNLNYIVSVPRRDRKAADIIPLCIPVEKDCFLIQFKFYIMSIILRLNHLQQASSTHWIKSWKNILARARDSLAGLHQQWKYLRQWSFKLLPDSGQEELFPHIRGVVLAALEPPGASLLHVWILPQRLPGSKPASLYIFNPPTSPPSWDDNRSDKGVVWRRGCGCKRSRTPDNGFRKYGARIKKLHLCCVDCVDFLQIGLVLGSSGASFACLLWCSSNIPFIRG